MESTDLVELLKVDDDDLYVRLTIELQGEGLGVGPSGRDAQRRFGRRWFEQWLEANRVDICSHPAVVTLVADEKANDTIDEATVLADVVLPFLGVLPVATVAVLVARRGLRRLCC